MQADLLDVLTRLASANNIRCMRVTPPFDGLDQFDYGLRKALDPYFDWQEFGSLLLQSTPPNTLLFAEGTFELQFALFRIPDEENAVFMIGPWATAERSEKSRSWARRHIGRKAMTLYRATITGCGFCRAAVSRLPSWQLFP
jgi:two-component system response regulator YesN